MSKTADRRTIKIVNKLFYLSADALERFEIVWLPKPGAADAGQLALAPRCVCGSGMFDDCDLSPSGGSLRCNSCGKDHDIK